MKISSLNYIMYYMQNKINKFKNIDSYIFDKQYRNITAPVIKITLLFYQSFYNPISSFLDLFLI